MRLSRPRSQWWPEMAIHAQHPITRPESHLWCSGGEDESRGHTELECLFHRMPTETRQTSRNKEAVRHYSFQSNLTSQGRWFIMVITQRLTLAGELQAVWVLILEDRCQIWPVTAIISRFACRQTFWFHTANGGCSELDVCVCLFVLRSKQMQAANREMLMQNNTNNHWWPEMWVTALALHCNKISENIQPKMCRRVNLVKRT